MHLPYDNLGNGNRNKVKRKKIFIYLFIYLFSEKLKPNMLCISYSFSDFQAIFQLDISSFTIPSSENLYIM